MTRIAIITCYKIPDYGRAVTLRTALLASPDIETVIIKNKRRGVLRYPEVIYKTLRTRADVYLLTFRGYEMLPFILLRAGHKPVIFDELVNPLEVVTEHRAQKSGLVAQLMKIWSLFGGLYKWLAKRCRVIIADTQVHAQYSAQLSNLDAAKFTVIPVGADEAVFKPATHPIKKDYFEVLFFGTMVPLHGLGYILDAAEQLKNHPDIKFRLVGGEQKAVEQILAAKSRGAHIEHQQWLEIDKLAELAAQTELCLCGPFGNTTQSKLVVTGKTFQSLASAAPTVVGQGPATEQAGLKDKVNCLVVPQGNSQAIVEAVLWSKEHQTELAKIGQAGHQLYQKEFSQKVINQKVTALLARL